MTWIDEAIERLSARQPCGYHDGAVPRSEPTALAVLALLAHDRADAARPGLDWLAEIQSAAGVVGPDQTEPSPPWFTAPAVLAWQRYQGVVDDGRYCDNIVRGVQALLRIAGKPLERSPEMGHDTTIVGWSWAEATHSWIEPTAWSVLALTAAGQPQHSRAVDGRRLLVDRLLADGGCNYGNTVVLGQALRPHLQPTGLAMLALAETVRTTTDPRFERTLDYLTNELSAATPSASLAYGLLGLAANDRTLVDAPAMLAAAAARTLRTAASPLRLALLALAQQPEFMAPRPLTASLHS